jgi:hypothetical protein
MKQLFRCFLFCLLPLSASGLLHAQEQEDVHPYLTNDFFVDVGIYFPDRETTLGVDGSVSGINSDFDFSQATRLKEDDETFSMDFGWGFGEKWTVYAQYFKSTGATGAALTEDVEWRDLVFEAGTNVIAGQEFSVTRLFFGYEFDSSPRHDFGVGLGIHDIHFRAFIRGEALISGLPAGIHAEIVGHDQLLPNIGTWYKYSISPNWAFRFRYDWMDASVDKYDGILTNRSIGVNYQVTENFGIGLNYQGVKLDVAVNKPSWRGRLEQRLEGVFVYLSAFW